MRGEESRALKCVRSRTAFSPPKCVAQLTHTWPLLTSSARWLCRQQDGARTPVSPSPASLPDLTPSLQKTQMPGVRVAATPPENDTNLNSQGWLSIPGDSLTQMQMPNQLHRLSIGKKWKCGELAEGEKYILANPNQIVSREVNSGFLKVFTFRYVEINTISRYTYHKWCTEMWCVPHHRLTSRFVSYIFLSPG